MKRSLLTSLLVPFVLAGSLHAASDYLLEIDGIKGESSDTRHPGTIEISSFSWGCSNTGSSASGGGTGKVSFSDLHFTTKVSKASPKLMLACATGQHIAQATIFVRKPGGATNDYYMIKMEDLLVSSFQSGGSGGGATANTDSAPTEEVAFYYSKVTVTHTADDGTVTTATAVRTPDPQ